MEYSPRWIISWAIKQDKSPKSKAETIKVSEENTENTISLRSKGNQSFLKQNTTSSNYKVNFVKIQKSYRWKDTIKKTGKAEEKIDTKHEFVYITKNPGYT